MAARPEDRYFKLEKKTLPNGRVVYKSARPINVATKSTDLIVTADEGDRMDIIANNVYGSPVEWWRIAAANKHVNGSLHLRPGFQLIIPQD
jgi:nucleoid-associated protein YgaU